MMRNFLDRTMSWRVLSAKDRGYLLQYPDLIGDNAVMLPSESSGYLVVQNYGNTEDQSKNTLISLSISKLRQFVFTKPQGEEVL